MWNNSFESGFNSSNLDNNEQPKLSLPPIKDEPMYQPKLLRKTPSIKAMRNYYNLSIDDNDEDNKYEANTASLGRSTTNNSLNSGSIIEDYDLEISHIDNYNENLRDQYGYNNLGAFSISSPASTGSELNSERKSEMGSTVKLVPKFKVSSQKWFSVLSTIVCTIALSGNIGNVFRLPQMTIIRGGLPFLVSYSILVILLGLPLLFLELGIGQLAQEGFLKSWRAVPFFRGVGYVKLIAGCLLAIYYPLYMGLSVYYIAWMAAGPLPFQDCATGVKITQSGYFASTKTGQECLKRTFLKSPFDDPSWLGIYTGIILVIWIILLALLIRKTKSYVRSLIILFFPVLGCFIALIVNMALQIDKSPTILDNFLVNDVDWNELSSANTWYFAAIQVFFSTNVGFGSFTTNAGIMYNRVSPLWTALGYILGNLIFGIGSIFITQTYIGYVNITNSTTEDIAELKLMALIYDAATNNKNTEDWITWGVIYHLFVLVAGFINLVTLNYTLLKAITVQTGRRINWWQTGVILCFIGFVVGFGLLLYPDFDLVHLLDHYIVGNLILVTVIIEVFVFIAFYGLARIRSDFEFMLGHILSRIWIILWWCNPILLTGIFAWGLITLPLEGIYKTDPIWLYGTGWGVVLISTIFIFVIGIFIVRKQSGYTLLGKLKQSLEPSSKWGPTDPIQRHNWIQWNSKAQKGERDFTLKRRGTKDYTRSIKKERKMQAAQVSELGSSITGLYSRKSDLGMTSPPQNYYLNAAPTTLPRLETRKKPMRVTSLVSTLNHPNYVTDRSSYPGHVNPLIRNLHNSYADEYHQDGSNSEGYGTFRRGPYIISGTEESHICKRDYEGATKL